MKQRGKLECISPGSGAADVGDAGDMPRLSQCSISCHSLGSKGPFSPRDECLLFCQMPKKDGTFFTYEKRKRGVNSCYRNRDLTASLSMEIKFSPSKTAFKARAKLGHNSPKHWQLHIRTVTLFHIKSEHRVGKALPNSSPMLQRAKRTSSSSFPSMGWHQGQGAGGCKHGSTVTCSCLSQAQAASLADAVQSQATRNDTREHFQPCPMPG